MTFKEARAAVLALLRSEGRSKNSTLIEVLGGDEEMYQRVREDLIFCDQAEDKKSVGLVYIGAADDDEVAAAAEVPAAEPVAPAPTTPDAPASPPTTPERPRLFLSYGRRDAAELAERLFNDLTERGFEIWMDRRNIRPGTPFMEEIRDGLRSCQVVIALLSPHSVRLGSDPQTIDHLDSVCLDELSYARFSPPPRKIVPVLAVPCEPPFVIYRLDYTDLCAWKDSDDQYEQGLERLLGAVADAGEGRERYRAWEDELRPWDFAARLDEKRLGFTGREWLFEEIEAWRSQASERALLITGDPGTGKSAVVAELVHRNPGGQVLAYHCCQADTPQTLDPARFVRNLAAMAASKIPAYAARLTEPAVKDALSQECCDADPKSAFEEGFLNPLQALPAPDEGVRYVLVDALDEALARSQGPTIVDLLSSRLGRLPPWMRIVATTRKERGVLDRLAGLSARELDAQDPRNLDDVRRYIEARLEAPDLSEKLRESGCDAGEVAVTLRDKAKGNFLYVTEVLKAIVRDDSYSLAKLEELPAGLEGIYEEFFERQFGRCDDNPEAFEARFGPAREVLRVVTAAREPLDKRLLSRATGLGEGVLPGVLRKLRAYLPEHVGAGGKAVYSVYHKSFADWLTDAGRDDRPFFISETKGHERLAEACWPEYLAGVGAMSRYALAHLPAHETAAERWDELETLLCDLRFVERKVAAGMTHELVGDYEAAVDALPEGREAREKEREREERVKRYTRDLVAHARRENPELELIPSVEPWSETRLEEDTKRILDSPTRADRIRVFSQFVNGEGHALAAFGHRRGFTVQRAYNWARSGPVPAAAERMLNESTSQVRMLLASAQRAAYNPHPACLRTLEGHTSNVLSVSVTPDARRAVSGSNDKTLRVWDVETGECLRTLEGHTDWVNSVSVTPDARRAVSGSNDKTLRVWDVETGECLRTLEGHTDGVRSVSVTPDARHAVSGSSDNTLRVWDVETGEEVAIVHAGSPVDTVSLIGTGTRLACGTWAGRVMFLTLRNLAPGTPWRTPERLWLYGVATQRGHWDDKTTAPCPCCGRRFVTPAPVLDTITAIARDAGVSPADPPSSKLPAEAWDEPRLLSECPHCAKPLRFNPFVVDLSDRM